MSEIDCAIEMVIKGEQTTAFNTVTKHLLVVNYRVSMVKFCRDENSLTLVTWTNFNKSFSPDVRKIFRPFFFALNLLTKNNVEQNITGKLQLMYSALDEIKDNSIMLN
jgi:hypothetical protein